MNFAWKSLAWIALASCSAEPVGNQVVPLEPVAETKMPTAVPDSASLEDFRTAYGSVLWTMMVLRWCDARWKRPQETAAAEARLAAIDAEAISRGLKPQMEQAANDNAQQMATMRLDTMCNGGFDDFHARAQQALDKLERLMAGLKDESGASG